MPGILYLVPTPIGNLGDLSDRMRETLAQADFVAAEDTRVTRKLLSHLDLHKPLVSYYEHNKSQSGPRIVERLLAGETCALVTDAGTPAISDPGEDLVRLCSQAGVEVVSIPGPCALITALTVSGQPTARFSFEGFLSTNKKNRRAHLDSLKQEQRTMIFYEAPHKLLDTLTDMQAVFGPERPVSLCRELTKLHEEIIRTTFGGALALYTDQAPRGEYVLVVCGAQKRQAAVPSMEAAVSAVLALQAEGVRLKDAVRPIAEQFGVTKNALYDAALAARDGMSKEQASEIALSSAALLSKGGGCDEV